MMDKDILIFLIITIVILVTGSIVIKYQIEDGIAECVSNPFPYAAEQYEQQYGKDVYGSFYIGQSRYSFNSTGVYPASLL